MPEWTTDPCFLILHGVRKAELVPSGLIFLVEATPFGSEVEFITYKMAALPKSNLTTLVIDLAGLK